MNGSNRTAGRWLEAERRLQWARLTRVIALVVLGTALAGLSVRVALAYSEVSFEHLSMEHGLAQSGVQAMVSDELGYMWFGTQYGLSRYDGYGFRNFRHEEGNPATLSNSRIQQLLKAWDGTLWVGTRAGLNRLDPRTLRIDRIAPESGTARPQILGLAEDLQGNLLVQAVQGLLFFEYETGRLRWVTADGSETADPLGCVFSDQSGRLWFYGKRGLWRFDPDTASLQFVLELSRPSFQSGQKQYAVLPDGQLALGGDHGVAFFDPAEEAVTGWLRPSDHGRAEDQVFSIGADPDGLLWILSADYLARYDPSAQTWNMLFDRSSYGASEQGGAYRLRPVRDMRGHSWLGLPEGVALVPRDGGEARLLRHDPTRPDSLSASPWSSTYSVYQDPFGVIWVAGGLSGLSRFAPQHSRFEHIVDQRADRLFGASNVVRSVLEIEREGEIELWTGMTASGIRVWRRGESGFDRIVAEFNSRSEEPRRLEENEVRALVRHPVSGEIWAGVRSGMIAISSDDYSVLRRVPVQVDGRPLRIEAIVFSEDGRTLYAAGGKRLLRFALDADGRRVLDRQVRPVAPDSVSDNQHGIFNLMRLSDGRLLAGTRRGLVVWDPALGTLQHEYPAGRPGEHPRNFIFGLAETDGGELWIGTETAGLARSRLTSGGFEAWRWYGTQDGLPDDTVYAIQPSPSGRLWLSSNRGLARFNPETGAVRRFTLADGLQALEFNNTVAAAGDSGLIYFGGINGVNAFRPEAIQLNPQPPRILLQQAELGRQPLSLDAGAAARAEVSYDRNDLVAEFVALHFVDPSRNRYAYRLAGVDDQWIERDSARRVRYPDLAPGDYDLTVKAANSDGVWSEPRTLLSLKVLPPVWMTAWAYAFYVTLAASLIGFYTMTQRRRRMKLEADVLQRTRELTEQKDLVDRQARALEESLEARSTVFANISHEFRTPLTLIEASLERLVRNPEDEAAFAAARRYLRRLLRLVDQLLNLSRLQASSIQTLPDPWSLDQVVTMTVDAFRPLAEEKEMTLEYDGDGRWSTQCQQADVERILLNLLGNAFKYCPRGSTIRVGLEAADDGVVISVADDGPGIALEEQEKIFERFNRVPAHEQGRIEGAGIGLTLVREAARSNGGDATVESEPGTGALFQVYLPAWRGHIQGAPVDKLAPQRLQLELETLATDGDEVDATGFEDGFPEGDSTGRLGRVLVAEDNPDLRKHLAEMLARDWQVLLAEDGQEALEMARDRAPDVVVSDIMMPRVDGLELLKRLRQDVRTSHLPVLLLTARTDDETRLHGYSLSADDFLAKPFNMDELRLRLRRMVDIRERVQVRLRRQLQTSGHAPVTSDRAESAETVPDLSDRDCQLLDRVQSWLEANHDDPEAAVSALAAFLSMDSRTLQRKLRSLTGRTPAEHLRHYRLERARCMLRESDESIQEIAYSCGFSSPQYFSRLFAQEEGLPPSNWRDQPDR